MGEYSPVEKLGLSRHMYFGVNGLNQDKVGACNCLQAPGSNLVAGLRTLARVGGQLTLDRPDGLIKQYFGKSIFQVNDLVT